MTVIQPILQGVQVMTRIIQEEFKDDLLSRGYSRRQMMNAVAMLGGASVLAGLSPEHAWAADAPMQPAKVRIGTNECWTGPMPAGLAALNEVASQCNRYNPRGEPAALVRMISQTENIPEDHISVWPGAYAALARSVIAFCSPTKGLVTCDPAYETPGEAAEWLGAPTKAVPLRADYSHDVKAMLAANPNAGLYYICNPNNPTATMTPMADMEWLVDNRPAGSIVVIDEAYIHWTRDYPNNTATHLAAAGKDVMVFRTFSKIFGMAGMRVGYFMARPDIIKKISLYDKGEPSSQLPIPSVACATASLTDHVSFAARRKELMTNRAATIDFLTKRNLKVIGVSDANFLMVDWKTKTAKEMQAAFRAQGVQIAGARWPTWPTVSRVTIGSKEDMEGFFTALNKVVSA